MVRGHFCIFSDYGHSPTYSVVTLRKIRQVSNLAKVEVEYTFGELFTTTLDRDRPQHDRPAAFVIAQQYSSSTFVSLRFCVLKENLADG